ncbi:MAG TPA: gliding motility-associated C-terminal domain-containing protein, partial [Parapedobacter sp.]|nr:gliding motility-associated C-terminal domain-containing protein [Parapedobacter sp.]
EEDGTVTIAPNTPAGTYSFDYRVCDVINPNNCSTATVTVVVAPAEIRATDDLITGVNGYEGTSNVANVFTNDQLNGTPIGPEDVTLTLIGGDPALRLNPDGSVDVLPGTRGGTYTLEYQICEKLNPDNCSVATVTITVVNPLKIPNVFTPNGDGRNDQFEIIGSEGFDRVEVTIVNRWGNEVYRNDDYQNDWSGQGLTEGTYYYLITTHLGSAREVHKGWVLIKRL